MAVWVIQPDVDARRTAHAVACHSKVRQCADHRLFHAVDVLLDEVARALQVDQRVGHHLARAVIGDLSPPVGGDHGDRPRVQHVIALACDPLCVEWVVLAQP
ncbi:hypothetical protein D3C71_1726460 [compost metagenome]